MNKYLLGATAAAVLSSGAANAGQHKPYSVLWNQNANFGSGVNSQNYEPGMEEYNDAAADDFVVPVGQFWYITEVDVTGTYVGGVGPATSVDVTFFRNGSNSPRKVKYAFTVSCTDNSGSFQCLLPMTQRKHPRPVVRLFAGTYWVSVVANCASTVCRQWQWTENTTVTDNEAQWEDPHGGWGYRGCGDGFEPLHKCFGGSPADLAFDLIGTVN